MKGNAALDAAEDPAQTLNFFYEKQLEQRTQAQMSRLTTQEQHVLHRGQENIACQALQRKEALIDNGTLASLGDDPLTKQLQRVAEEHNVDNQLAALCQQMHNQSGPTITTKPGAILASLNERVVSST